MSAEKPSKTQPSSQSSRLWDLLGWLSILLFIAIYCVELLPHKGRPRTLAWIEATFGTQGLIILNIVIVIAFLLLLPYRKPTKHVWKTRSAFMAFAIALMTEMFGFPLLIFMVAPLIEVPNLSHSWFHTVGHWPASVGTGLSFIGILLVAQGWRQIHRATDLVDNGLYRYIRHPQYTGLILFSLGWLVHWPSWFTILLWPILILAYAWLARFEENMALEEFGDRYVAYQARSKRFVPFLI